MHKSPSSIPFHLRNDPDYMNIPKYLMWLQFCLAQLSLSLLCMPGNDSVPLHSRLSPFTLCSDSAPPWIHRSTM